MAEDWEKGGFGLYIHWPYCAAKCPYCDFNSHVADGIDHGAWREAYIAEIDRYAARLPGRVLNTVFFGGGTPSLMSPETVHAVLDRIRASWPVANDLEVTLEANPGSVEAGRFAGFADAGVTRLSLGVQTLDDDALRRLGRIHSVADARRAYDVARNAFGRVSFDLIYARQDQGLDDWRRELNEALAMAADHLSLYQLTIEPGTAFGARHAQGGLRGLPQDDLAADMYELTQGLCDAAGLQAYEVSNHAVSGSESRHNMIYWRYGDYVGIGPGAHGRITVDGERRATRAVNDPAAWLRAASSGACEDTSSKLSRTDQADEYLMMGLRLVEGIDMDRYAALAGKPIRQGARSMLSDLGLISENGSRLHVTPSGRILLNGIIREFLSG
ncbi:radical SAM family heme chaperone HemW [Roseovarius salinarum]|uniref:radical SAM family heme chaperone HemW n=1 Tax=Roseovarius salinarum TaxID=1981892 RepID=UPI000C32EA78|nr:radical SAM family heme chaperone HemW [Roseovarius salinarum]